MSSFEILINKLDTTLYPECARMPADRGTRLEAACIDIFFLLCVLIPVLSINYLSLDLTDEDVERNGFETIQYLIIAGVAIIGLAFAITQIYFMTRYSQSIGKRIMKIYVVCASTDQRCGFNRYFWRRVVLGNIVLSIIPFYDLIDVCMIYSEDRRCLHDRIADTTVLNCD